MDCVCIDIYDMIVNNWQPYMLQLCTCTCTSCGMRLPYFCSNANPRLLGENFAERTVVGIKALLVITFEPVTLLMFISLLLLLQEKTI